MADRLLTMKEVAELTRLGRSTIYKKIKAYKFPAGVTVFNRHRWWLSEIVKFMGGDVSLSDAVPKAGGKPRRVKLAIHKRGLLRKNSTKAGKSPPTSLTVLQNSQVSRSDHNKLSGAVRKRV